MKKVLLFTIVLLLLSACALPAFAATPTVKIIDNAGYLTNEEEAGLIGAISGSSSDAIYCIVTVNAYSQPSKSAMFDLCGCSENDAVIALCIYHDGSEYCYYLYTFGPAQKLISDSAVDRILDNNGVYGNIKSGRIAAGSRAFLVAADSEYTAAVKQAEEKAARHEATRVPRAIGVGLLVGAIVGGVAVLIVVIVYRRKQHGEIYPLDRYARLNLTLSQDRFIGSYVTRVRVNNSSSSGSRGGGGGSFSGGGRGGR